MERRAEAVRFWDHRGDARPGAARPFPQDRQGRVQVALRSPQDTPELAQSEKSELPRLLQGLRVAGFLGLLRRVREGL